MPNSSALFASKQEEPHISRRSERYTRSFQITINGVRYRGNDISLGGLSFFMAWGGATFAKGQVLSVTLHVNIEGIYEKTHLSLQIASFRLNKETGERIYGCAFQSLAGQDVVNMVISGVHPKAADLAKERKQLEATSELKSVLETTGNFNFLMNLVNELSYCAVDEKTSNEEFRVNSAMSLCHIQQCLKNLSNLAT